MHLSDNRDMVDRTYSAEEAAERLGISLSTLYAYVSRGLLQSQPDASDPRRRRYPVAEVLRLQQRQQQRRKPELAARSALRWGSPVLESQLTNIGDGGYRYRGHDALQLAQQERFERVAALLWFDQPERADALFSQKVAYRHEQVNLVLSPIERWQVLLAQAAADDLGAFRPTAETAARSGVRVLKLMTAAVCGREVKDSLAATLQKAWLPELPQAETLFNSVLVICADHELNISAFTARCIASARATPYQAVIGALGAFSGWRHGGASERAHTFLAAAERDPAAAIRQTLQRGERIPGFHHPLYPDGDPRYRLLREMVAALPAGEARAELGDSIAQLVWQHLQLRPNIDFGLALLAQSLALPANGGQTLFALGRTAGWIAHIIEQVEQADFIRPRAAYTGVRAA